jgi:hypothetical protein
MIGYVAFYDGVGLCKLAFLDDDKIVVHFSRDDIRRVGCLFHNDEAVHEHISHSARHDTPCRYHCDICDNLRQTYREREAIATCHSYYDEYAQRNVDLQMQALGAHYHLIATSVS